MGGGFIDAARMALALLWNFDAGLGRVVALSLYVSGTACLIASVFGMALGAWLAVARFPGRRGVIALLNTLLALPSVVVGLVVYLLLSRAGPLGSLGILFTPTAMIVAFIRRSRRGRGALAPPVLGRYSHPAGAQRSARRSTMFAYTPAIASSAMMPKPPGRRSRRFAGTRRRWRG